MCISDYKVDKVSEEVKKAMATRCYEQGHSWRDNDTCSNVPIVYKCKWCGEEYVPLMRK